LFDALLTKYRGQGKASPQVLSHLKPMRAKFDDWRAVEVTTDVLDAYIGERQEAGKAKATVNREVQLIGQALRLAAKGGKLMAVPEIPRLSEKDNVRRGFLGRPQFEAVARALPKDLADAAQFAYVSSWRRGEVFTLLWSDVDRQTGLITL